MKEEAKINKIYAVKNLQKERDAKEQLEDL
jgi:hypothetical protein